MASKQKVQKITPETKKDPKDGRAALFIPAGVLLGMGFGFFSGNFPACMFLGLGTGMVVFAILTFIKK